MSENENSYINYIEKIIEFRIRYKYNNIDPDKDIIEKKVNIYGDRWYNKNKVIYTRNVTEMKDTIYYNEAKDFIEMKTSKEQTFMSLWSFCDFIRWAEKLFLYNNNESDLIYCDSSINNIDNKTFAVNREDSKIYFRLSMPKTIDITSNNNLDFHKKIDIVVERNFGKEMKNKYTIVDEKFRYNDNSDVILMNYINIVLNSAINDTYSKILLKAMKYLDIL